MQKTKEEDGAEISASSSEKMVMNDMLTRPNQVAPKIEMQQELAEDERTAEDELTETVMDGKPNALESTANRQEADEQVQTVVMTDTQRVSDEDLFENNEQVVFLKNAAIADNELDAMKKDDLISEHKSDMVQEAKTEDKGAEDPEDAESILYETRLLTSPEKSYSSVEIMNAYLAALPRGQKNEHGPTTSLLYYMEGSEHATLRSHEVERSTEETRASSAIKEDPGHFGVGEDQPIKESSDSFNFDEPPRILSIGSVNYPFHAKRLGVTGKVSVSFLVDTDGHPMNIEAVKAEPANVLVTFAEAAEKAIAKCRFKPGTSAGEPVPVKVMAPIRFEI